MNSNKAAYWIVLAVFVFGLNNEYRQGNLVALHKVAERADSAFCRLAIRAQRTLVAVGLAGDRQFTNDHLLASAAKAEMFRERSEFLREQAQDEADFVRDRVLAQAEVIRAQVEMTRPQVEQIRWKARSQARLAALASGRLMVNCPKSAVRVVANGGVDSLALSPHVEVEVEDTF